MGGDDAGALQLRDAALVQAVRQGISDAVEALAARPLDESAAAQMRHALGSRADAARAALRRLGGPPAGSTLAAVPDDPVAASEPRVPAWPGGDAA